MEKIQKIEKSVLPVVERVETIHKEKWLQAN
jgi:hypothetical protein